ncbi:MAG: L-lactate MFS transporter [Candidatus Hermodarchaeia archaeon]|jgi:OFA family oxalate/formate antiporter-like MFS transporter
MSDAIEASNSRRYLVVLGALIIQVCLGSIYAWSIFQSALREGVYGWTSLWTQLPFAAGLASFAALMIIAGVLQDRIGPRKVATIGGVLLGAGYLLAGLVDIISQGNALIGTIWLVITYGIIAGAGIGFAYVCPIAALVKWFPDKKGLITGIAVAGFGAGALVMGYVETWLLVLPTITPLVGGAFLALGILYLVLVISGSQLLSNPPLGWTPPGYVPPKGTNDAKGQEYNPRGMNLKVVLVLLWFMFLFAATAGLMTLGNVKSAAAAIDPFSAGLPTWGLIAAIIVGVMSIFNAIGRIVWGTVSDRFGRYSIMIAMFILLAIGMFAFAYLSMTFASWITVMIVASLVGFCFGGNFALFPALTVDYNGPKNLGSDYGILFTAYGVAGIIGALAAGLIVNFTGSYALAFMLTGVLALFAVFLAVMHYLIRKPIQQ